MELNWSTLLFACCKTGNQSRPFHFVGATEAAGFYRAVRGEWEAIISPQVVHGMMKLPKILTLEISETLMEKYIYHIHIWIAGKENLQRIWLFL